MNKQITLWLFCRVIDNFGDIGVAWRLARQLSLEQNYKIVLWVDDLQAVHALLPNLNIQAAVQILQHITIVHWQSKSIDNLIQSCPCPDVVIETFACELPTSVQALIAQNKLLWLNLEYLAAEAWVDDIHLMPSLQHNGAKKFFFCPGFTSQTGGLSVELAMKNQSSQPQKLTYQQTLRRKFNLPEFDAALHMYVFGYVDEVWLKWIEMWQHAPQKTVIWMARGGLFNYLQMNIPAMQGLQNNGDHIEIGQLTVCLVAFVAQSEFDEVLQAADVNIVRGEDSVLRALWQGKVFWWHIYQQNENAHHSKLHAFWQRCLTGIAEYQVVHTESPEQNAWQAHQLLSDELNGVLQLSQLERAQAWQIVLQYRLELQAEITLWRNQLWQQDSLATQLANFIRIQLK